MHHLLPALAVLAREAMGREVDLQVLAAVGAPEVELAMGLE